MEKNKLHSGGKKDYKKELLRKMEEELKQVNELEINREGKKTLIEKIKLKFKEMLNQSDDSLFLSN